jgi:hypothetical protein
VQVEIARRLFPALARLADVKLREPDLARAGSRCTDETGPTQNHECCHFHGDNLARRYVLREAKRREAGARGCDSTLLNPHPKEELGVRGFNALETSPPRGRAANERGCNSQRSTFNSQRSSMDEEGGMRRMNVLQSMNMITQAQEALSSRFTDNKWLCREKAVGTRHRYGHARSGRPKTSVLAGV